MLTQLSKKKGKIDRTREQDIKKLEQSRIYLNPRTGTEQTIKDFYNDFRAGIGKVERTVQDTLDLYLNSRNMRHEVWVDLLNTLSTTRENVFGDVQFGNFINKHFPRFVKDDHTNYRMTPDILMLAHNDYVLLGDVAVTKAPNSTNRHKYFKYHPLELNLKANNVKVRHTNLIIDETLSNYRCELQRFVELEIIKVDENAIKRAVEYHRTCQVIMDNVTKQCTDMKEFSARLQLIDSAGPTPDDISLDEAITKNYQLPKVEVALSEREIIQMIKDKTDENIDYFDGTVSDALLAFDKLLKPSIEGKKLIAPKSILKVCANTMSIESDTGYGLVRSYIQDLSFGDDNEVKQLILDFLPSRGQLNSMEKIYNDKANSRKAMGPDKILGVYGPFQYNRTRTVSNQLTSIINEQLTMGKRKKNRKTAPDMVNPEVFTTCVDNVESHINYYGTPSAKDHYLDDTWDAKTNFEHENSKEERINYEYAKSTNGAQLSHSLSNLYHRIMHLKTSLSTRDNIYIPPNGAFLCIMPKEHAPVNSPRCDMPMLFITRVDNAEQEDTKNLIINGIEYEYKTCGSNYTYFVSKLCRLNVDKIAHWNQLGYKLVASSSYLLSTCEHLRGSQVKLVGTLTLLMIDGHQKTSEYLDLLKYISFMPFSDISRLPNLIQEKCDLLIKTKLDIWLLSRMRAFIEELSNIDKLNATKPKLQLFNSSVTRDSLGMSLNLPTFINPSVRHSTIADFIEEISMMFIVRPKQLYGSQFMDKAMTNVVDWTIEFEDEKQKYGGWALSGFDNTPYPFESKFCFSRDAIYHAQEYVNNKICPDKRRIARALNRNPPTSYMHYNCSLRGCVKDPKHRKNVNDLNTTSLDECLKYYRDKNYVDEDCTVLSMATEFIKNNNTMEFCMSEKEQRGGGRPIATPTLGAKACLMMVEKPEQAIGENMDNNIIVAGKHKLKAQSEAYKTLLSEGAVSGYKQIYQLTEDQTKFSENDNFRKFEHYIASNTLLPINIRTMQGACLNKLANREHLIKRMPLYMKNDPKYDKHRNMNLNGYVTDIGWPQGMLNMISTSVHSIADYWITHAYNIAYPDDTVITSGLVHSDDSWVAVACNSLDIFKKFTIFRTYAKRLFCLKMNDKKVWGSRYLGELVSNYNINGNVHLSVAKTLSNSFGNLLYQNWSMDVHTQISSIQQAYRNGANLPTLIMLSTILRQQMIDCYQVSGFHKRHIYQLPIEMGGYPDTSAMELGVTGVTSHYKRVLETVKTSETSVVPSIILKALRLSVMYTLDKEKISNTIGEAFKSKTDLIKRFQSREEINDLDYQSIAIPSRGDVFSCIRQIMPKSKKVTATINEINMLPFESDGIELIVTRPDNLSTALGNLKTQSSTLLFDLASQKYSQSSRRLAVSQAIQSSGRVIRVADYPPMTINEMLYFIDQSPVIPLGPEMLEVALNDESDLSTICESCVYRAEYDIASKDKRKIINKQPEDQDKFKTICKLKNVLLYIIDDKLNTDYLTKYGTIDEPADILKTDALLIKKRFAIYFGFFKTKYACNLIMQQYLTRQKSKLWMQPYLNSDSIISFMCDLYGKTVSKDINYRVNLMLGENSMKKDEEDIINSLYTVSVLNTIYPNKFKLTTIRGEDVIDSIKNIDYTTLSNETYIKFGILCSLYLQDDNHLDEYDNRKMYDQYYTKPQEYVDGRWVGSFECVCRYGDTVVKFSGEPENINITVNKVNISDILCCMHTFIKQNFKYYTYQFPANWSSCAFWDTKFKVSLLYLTSYSRIVTMVTQKAGLCSVSLRIDKYMKMPVTYNTLKADKFLLEENLRIVTKEVDGRRVRVANIPQTMSCPYATSIQVEPDLLDGFDNNFLLRSRTIINLTTNRVFNCIKGDVLKLLDSRLPPINGEAIINFYWNMLNSFGDMNIMIENANIEEPQEIKTIEITGISSHNFLDEHLMTTPEDLSFLETEYVYDDEIRAGSLYRHPNITRALCSVISSIYNSADVNSVISLILHDKDLARALIADLDSQPKILEEKIEDCKDAADIMEVDMTTNCFIIGNQLDCAEGFAKIDLRAISTLTQIAPTQINYKLFLMMKKELLENVHSIISDDDDPVVNLLTRLRYD